MKRVAEISNHNIVRNSDAYMASSGQINPDNKFLGLITRTRKEKKNSKWIINF